MRAQYFMRKGLLLSFVFVLSFTLFLFPLSTTYAQNEDTNKTALITKEEAIKLAESYIRIPAKYQLINVNFNTNWGYPDRSVWNLNWNLKAEGKDISNIHVTIDASEKTFLALDFYQYEEKQPLYPANTSKDEAITIANQFIAEIFPSITESLQVDSNYMKNYHHPLGTPVYYHIPYRKLINNIPLADPVATIQINGDGKVINFHYSNPEPIQFEKLDSTVSLEAAKIELAAQLEMNLSYVFPYQAQSTSIPFIAYRPNISYLRIDAKTGKLFILPDQKETLQEKYSPIVDPPLAAEDTSLDKELSQEEAINIATAIKNKWAPNTPDFQHISYDTKFGTIERGFWNLSWYDKESQIQPTYGHMMIDAKTGELVNFYYDKWSKESDPIISYDEAKKSAIDVVMQYAPTKAHEVYLKEIDSNIEKQNRVYFTFHRMVHQIPSERETITVTIDTHTGKMVSYQMNWGDVKYPEKLPALISAKKAKDNYLNKLELELVYFSASPKYDESIKDQTRNGYLVYQPVSSMESPIFMDAVDGKWRDMADGNPVEKIQPKDTVGHWAEKELQLMVDYHGLELEDGNLLPDKKITRGELIKMFIMATSGGRYIPYIEGKKESFTDVKIDSPYFGYIEEALQRQIITVDETQQFNPDQEVTREELAQLIVRSLGYDKLAQTEDLFLIPFKDKEQFKYAGQIAIVSSLKIMNGDGVAFYPQRKVTRAEAAVAFYRFLNARNQYKEINVYY